MELSLLRNPPQGKDFEIDNIAQVSKSTQKKTSAMVKNFKGMRFTTDVGCFTALVR